VGLSFQNFKKPSNASTIKLFTTVIEQCTLKNVNNFLNTTIYSYLEMSGGQRYNLYI